MFDHQAKYVIAGRELRSQTVQNYRYVRSRGMTFVAVAVAQHAPAARLFHFRPHGTEIICSRYDRKQHHEQAAEHQGGVKSLNASRIFRIYRPMPQHEECGHSE